MKNTKDISATVFFVKKEKKYKKKGLGTGGERGQILSLGESRIGLAGAIILRLSGPLKGGSGIYSKSGEPDEEDAGKNWRTE